MFELLEPLRGYVSPALNLATAVGTLVAALAAAWGAWAARLSAKHAAEAVHEARLARTLELAPRLVLEKAFWDFSLHWPHPSGVNNGPVYLARKSAKDQSLIEPGFLLKNFGQNPAIDLNLIFELDDENGDFLLPKERTGLGVQLSESPVVGSEPRVPILNFSQPGSGSGTGLPLYSRQVVSIPNVSPGESREVEFPQGLLTRLFLRGMQYQPRMCTGTDIKEIELKVTIFYHNLEGESADTVFRYRIFPFGYFGGLPIEINGHCFELPRYDFHISNRVAW